MRPTLELDPQWEWHYRTLSRLRDALSREHEEHVSTFRQPVERGGQDNGDIAENQREHLELLAELRAERAELSEIEAALARIRDGTYGICEATGEPIAPLRLRFLPWTRLSGPAAAKLEEPHLV